MDGAENGLCCLRPVEAVACGSDHPVERVGRVAPIPILASIAPPAIVDLRADDSCRAILGVGFVRKVEYLLKCVALKEVYVDQVALCVLRQPRIPWELIRCGGDTPLVQHVQTKDAYWCGAMTVSAVGKHERRALSAMTSHSYIASSSARNGL